MNEVFRAIKTGRLEGMKIEPLDIMDHAFALRIATETGFPDRVQWVLDNTQKQFSYYDGTPEGRLSPPQLNVWDAISRHPGHLNDPAVAALIISHQWFHSRCERIGCAPDDWQSACSLLKQHYHDNCVIWNAVYQNQNLPEAAREYAMSQIRDE